MRFPVKGEVEYVVQRVFFSRNTSLFSGVACLLSALLVRTLKCVAGCTQNAECTAGRTCDCGADTRRIAAKCSQLLVPVIFVVVLTRVNSPYVIHVNVLQTLVCFDVVAASPSDRKWNTCGTCECPRTVVPAVNEYPILSAWTREPWRRSRNIARELKLSIPKVVDRPLDDELDPYHCSLNAPCCQTLVVFSLPCV